jgi:hypothetical protein
LERIAAELCEAGDGGWMLTCAEAEATAGPEVALRDANAEADVTARPQVALLGHFDPYLVGYASRDLVLDPRFAKRIQAGGGFVAPAILVDGRVVGTWRRDWLEPFAPLADDVRAALEREQADVERFLAAAP